MISFVIPSYNSQSFITDAIDSIFASSKSYDVEVIVVDDCSTDNTLHVLDKYSDSRLRVYSLESNKGPSYARNVGCSHALGDYVYFLDSDDIVSENLVSEIVNVIKTAKAPIDFICVRIDFCTRDLTPLSINKTFGNKDIIELNRFSYHEGLLENSFLFTASSTCVKRSVIESLGKFDEASKFTEDAEFWSRLSFNHEGVLINTVLAYYRVVENSLSSVFVKTMPETPILLLTLQKQKHMTKNDSVNKSFYLMLFKYLVMAKSSNSMDVYRALVSVYSAEKNNLRHQFLFAIINYLPKSFFARISNFRRKLRFRK
ncbi:glycosyltransferase family 2 protein [Vibrio parahaemolyticus]|uniref:Glycosyl transferase family protein n=1 Tax=Vibrio parahaemolyticus TaxID=670 RepID=A0A5P4S6J1_VIBPH|nr:glycosyltransferase family 2 protein [Vibrio parahaemolyticus]EGR0202210.1 glycosyltransferase family 2 protein [Vibrio parahaemolyticus]EGR2290432.1 glycosyltransferase family 2 protein [Vibrio parahaemolyticus]EGR3401025.1 glycosyltransferase family 2 protein [Vibrio parahaemolyticus]EGR9082040.1 glycosyltransferase family 2 protein [Vibrio parahaemolyticus]EII5648212.1 glycosyltransferase family 2 protein [Vibrio parahaemolyticus]